MLASSYHILEITGKGSENFLQGQLTCDMRTVNEFPTFTALCNHQGRVLASGWIIRSADTFLWILPSTLINLAHNALKKYALFSKITMIENPPKWQIILSASITHELQINIKEKEMESQIQKGTIIWKNWHLQCLRKGIAEISASSSGKFTPHELGYTTIGAVSFNKGCYLGQEIIARMHYRGKLKKHLHHIAASEQVISQADIFLPIISQDSYVVSAHLLNNAVEALVIAHDDAIKIAHENQQIVLKNTFG
jgi:folate-binding protein YgfZ